ncbi:MAG: DUF3168 domain-containing protein [Proteobacteria bacterium]|nr:DUF3168 domain-containing protein [Pseudomonadota bacterium]
MTNASFALQGAVFAALSGDGTIQSLLGTPPRIYDAVPRGASFPYAVLGDGKETNAGTATEEGSEHVFAVTAWSRNGGHAESKSIADAIRFRLNNATLSLNGHALVDLRFLNCDYARETDGETYSATLRFRAVTEPA